MKVLLLGHFGYLGSYLFEYFKFDVLENRNVYFNGKKYDYVINCIGKSNLEYCESHELETNYSNAEVINDIIKCYPNSKIINFSSYYVYDDIPICTENSKVTDKYNYTKQKLKSEKLINKGLTFRVGKLFGNPLKNQNKLTDYIIDNENLFLDDVKFNPTSLDQVIKAIEYELNTSNLNGVYNLANDGFTTHYEYGVFINNHLKTNKKITKLKKINRNFHNYGRFFMSCEKLKNHIELIDWKIDLINYLNKCVHK